MQWEPPAVFVSEPSLCSPLSLQNVSTLMHGAFFFPVAFPCSENHVDPDHHHHHHHHRCQHPELAVAETPSPDASAHHFYHYTPKCFLTVHRGEWGISPWSFSCLATRTSFSHRCDPRRRTGDPGPVHSDTIRRGGLARRHHQDHNPSRERGGGAQRGQQLQGGLRP